MSDEVTPDLQPTTTKRRSINKQWLFLGVALISAIYIIGIAIPTQSRNIEISTNAHCRNNLKQLSLALKQYAMDYADRFPSGDGIEGFKKLQQYKYITDFSFLCCPSSKLTNQETSYVYFGDFIESSSDCCPPNQNSPIIFDRPENHKDYINYITLDGHFEHFSTKAKNCAYFIEEMNIKFKYQPKVLKILREKAAEADRRYSREK